MPVLERNGSLVAGPERWPGSLAALTGLRGNALPTLPYATEAGTLRHEIWEPGDPPEGKIAVRGHWSDGEIDGEGRWAAPTLFEGAPPPPVPDAVRALAGKLILMDMDLLAAVKALVEGHEYEGIRLFWDTATIWERADPYLNGLALELELTDEQVDDMFRAAEVRT